MLHKKRQLPVRIGIPAVANAETFLEEEGEAIVEVEVDLLVIHLMKAIRAATMKIKLAKFLIRDP